MENKQINIKINDTIIDAKQRKQTHKSCHTGQRCWEPGVGPRVMQEVATPCSVISDVNPQRCWYAGGKDLLCNAPLGNWRFTVGLSCMNEARVRHHSWDVDCNAPCLQESTTGIRCREVRRKHTSTVSHPSTTFPLPQIPSPAPSQSDPPRTFPPIPTPDNDPEFFFQYCGKKCLQDNKVEVL